MKKKRGSNKLRVMAGVGFIACACLLLYPFVSDMWNRYVDSKAISTYNSEVSANEQLYEQIYDDAVAYNASSVSEQVVTNAEYDTDDDAYNALLDPTGNGMMGYLEIPCIDVNDPIYHYSTDEILQKGIGHIHGSSLPVGGENTHVVLTGHRGLPSQKFLSDLDKVKIGDKFYIHILNHVLAYQVYGIQTVLPTEVEGLKIEQGKDLVTLVTCTPYGINTHRLLVTGKRIPYDDTNAAGQNAEAHHIQLDRGLVVFCGFILFAVLKGIFVIIDRKKIIICLFGWNKDDRRRMAHIVLQEMKAVHVKRDDDMLDNLESAMKHKKTIVLTSCPNDETYESIQKLVKKRHYRIVTVTPVSNEQIKCLGRQIQTEILTSRQSIKALKKQIQRSLKS